MLKLSLEHLPTPYKSLRQVRAGHVRTDEQERVGTGVAVLLPRPTTNKYGESFDISGRDVSQR